MWSRKNPKSDVFVHTFHVRVLGVKGLAITFHVTDFWGVADIFHVPVFWGLMTPFMSQF